MIFFLVTIRHDQECDIIEFVDLLFPWAWSCIRLFLSVDCLRRFHYTKSKFLPLSASFLVAFSLKICVCIVRTFGLSVFLVYYFTNSWIFSLYCRPYIK